VAREARALRRRTGSLSRAAAGIGLGAAVIHDKLLINLASPDRVMRTRSIQAFHDELAAPVSLDADFLVAHPGPAWEREIRRPFRKLAQGCAGARGMKLGGLAALVENTSGMGIGRGGAGSKRSKTILDETRDLPMGGMP